MRTKKVSGCCMTQALRAQALRAVMNHMVNAGGCRVKRLDFMSRYRSIERGNADLDALLLAMARGCFHGSHVEEITCWWDMMPLAAQNNSPALLQLAIPNPTSTVDEVHKLGEIGEAMRLGHSSRLICV